jgi:hypothetical protein
VRKLREADRIPAEGIAIPSAAKELKVSEPSQRDPALPAAHTTRPTLDELVMGGFTPRMA